MNTENQSIRPSPIAGTWYSDNPKELAQTVDTYITNATLPEIPGEVIGVVAPHAGYMYSGAVAGHAYKSVAGKSFDTVVVLSPSHQYHPQLLLTSAHSLYQTPLGTIPVAADQMAEINQGLVDNLGISMSPIEHDREHSLEIELPFLQRALNGPFELIPIMMRDQSREIAKGLGLVLAEVLEDRSFLIVASTDLSHFYPEATAHRLDHKVLSAMADFSPEGLFKLKDSGQGHACGLAAVAAALWAARKLKGNQVTLLKYDTSATATGDRTSVVGYGAAAITRPY